MSYYRMDVLEYTAMPIDDRKNIGEHSFPSFITFVES